MMSTGTSLRKVPSHDLYDIALCLMRDYAIMYEDQHKAIEGLKRQINDKIFEWQTGLPAIARQFAPADGSSPL
mgnify:CR=1 FL=1